MIAPLLSEAPVPRLTTALEADWACTWVNLDGQLVESTVAVFERALKEAMDLRRRKIVLLTLDVTEVDAAGVASIERARDLARGRGTKFAVRTSRRSLRPVWTGLGLRT